MYKTICLVIISTTTAVALFFIGTIFGMSLNIEISERECIEIPSDKMIVITRSEMLLETLKEKE